MASCISYNELLFLAIKLYILYNIFTLMIIVFIAMLYYDVIKKVFRQLPIYLAFKLLVLEIFEVDTVVQIVKDDRQG